MNVLFIKSSSLGQGEIAELGHLLMHKFLHEVGASKQPPDTVVLINSGVTLVTEESPVLGELKLLEGKNTTVLACGTCLARYEITDNVAVGKISDMTEIADTLLKAEKVISL